ncbi:hypothetical protein ABW19_dt0207623 [Dactylella cylindrospora]|nr:hypothetical protein ABW19_dt0207623 [Dactylella cylindrospora]
MDYHVDSMQDLLDEYYSAEDWDVWDPNLETCIIIFNQTAPKPIENIKETIKHNTTDLINRQITGISSRRAHSGDSRTIRDRLHYIVEQKELAIRARAFLRIIKSHAESTLFVTSGTLVERVLGEWAPRPGALLEGVIWQPAECITVLYSLHDGLDTAIEDMKKGLEKLDNHIEELAEMCAIDRVNLQEAYHQAPNTTFYDFLW